MTVDWYRNPFEDEDNDRQQQQPCNRSSGLSRDDFYAYMPMHNYIFAPCRDLWPASSVNARLPAVQVSEDEDGKPVNIPASAWLDKHKPVEQMTWAPGEAMIVVGRLMAEGGWVERPGVGCFNLYRAPPQLSGDPGKAGRWLDHVNRVYPDEADHIVRWLAHRVQRPAEKINHALVLGGLQGIGKDSLLEPVKRAIGPWNWGEVSPRSVFESRFNGYLKSVVLRISEARDFGEANRFKFYDHMKSITAAPPDVLRIDEKHRHEYYIANCAGVIITTNYKADGIYLPADDRRHFVAWSSLVKEDFEADYWPRLWGWYDNGGAGHVAAYLAALDLAGFDPKAPPAKTAAFWDIVNANQAPEDAELADVLDKLSNPDVITLTRVIDTADTVSANFADWLRDRKNRRVIPHRFEACGYVPVRNPDAKSGLWRITGRREVIYARSDLNLRQQLTAIRQCWQ